jgi:iron complex outermembrane recepter protein
MNKILRGLPACALASLATQASADESSNQYTLDIERLPIVAALTEFSRQTGLQVGYMPKNSAEENTVVSPLSGQYTADSALTEMLAPSGLQFERVNEKTLAVTSPPSAFERLAYSGDAEKSGLWKKLRLAQAETPSGVAREDRSTSKSRSVDQENDGPLEEVVVTAQKRQERLVDVPLSISAVSGDDLDKRGINNATALSFTVPSLTVTELGGGRDLVAIRGISGVRGSSALVGVYLDEAPVSGNRIGYMSNLDVRAFDFDRVEVLKGPQGTLFGEGSAGGVIRYITKDPDLDRLGGSLEASYLSTDDGGGSQHVTGVVNLPVVNDVLGVRIAGLYENNGGWIDNVGTGQSNINDSELKDVRAKALFSPNERLSVRALIDVHRDEGGGVSIVNLRPFDKSHFRQAYDINYPTGYRNDYELYSLTPTYDLGFATLLGSVSYYEVDNIQVNTQYAPDSEFLCRDCTAIGSSTSYELRLTSNGSGPLKWLVGGSYKKSKGLDAYPTGFGVNIPPDFNVANNFAGYEYEERSEALAGFADGSYEFGRLEVGGGVRVFEDKRDNQQWFEEVQIVDISATFSRTTYRAFIKYRLTEDVNIYANTATGFRSGTFRDPAVESLGLTIKVDPENSRFHEAGLKAKLLGGRANVELAIFKGEYSDQIQDVATIETGTYLQYSVNAGVAELEGVEWLLRFLPTNNLRLSISGDYIDTKYTQVSSFAPVAIGDPISYVPKYNFMVTADYDFLLAAGIPGYLNIGYSRKGEMQDTVRNQSVGYVPVDKTDPLDFLQASIGMQWRDYEVTVFARNILDERGRLGPGYTGYWSQARPRTIGLSLKKDF